MVIRMHQAPTAAKRLADLLLGEPVETWIAQRREKKVAYRLIARELFEATDGEIDVTDNTIRNWLRYAEPNEPDAAA